MTGNRTILLLGAIAGLLTTACQPTARSPGGDARATAGERPNDGTQSQAQGSRAAVKSSGNASDEQRSSPSATAKRYNSKREGGRVVEASFDDIKFDIEPDETFHRDMLTEDVKRLFDRTVRIRGYMLPAMRRKGLKQFVLVRDNQECCFGPGAALYDCVLVQMQEGRTAEYSIRPVAVEGTFRFLELKDPVTGRHLAVFQIEGMSVE